MFKYINHGCLHLSFSFSIFLFNHPPVPLGVTCHPKRNVNLKIKYISLIYNFRPIELPVTSEPRVMEV